MTHRNAVGLALAAFACFGLMTSAQTTPQKRPQAKIQKAPRRPTDPVSLLRDRNPGTIRLIAQIIRNDPASSSVLSALHTTPKNIPVALQVLTLDGRWNCGPVVSDGVMDAELAALASELSQPFVASDATSSEGLAMTLSFTACTEQVTTSDERPITSRYVASYQQLSNPTYVQLQSRLQQLNDQ
jgi:hypothetical protein